MAKKYTKFERLVLMYKENRIFLYRYGKPVNHVVHSTEYEIVGFDSDHKKVLVKNCGTLGEETWSMQKVNASDIRYVERPWLFDLTPANY